MTTAADSVPLEARRRRAARTTEAGSQLRRQPTATLPFHAVPWSKGDNVVSLVLVAIGTLGAGYCSYKVGDEIFWDAQVDWMFGALLFAGLGLLGVVGWLTSGSRNIKAAECELRKRYAVVFRGVMGYEFAAHPRAADAPAPVGGLVTAPGMQRYHRENCPVVRNKAVRPLDSGDLTVLEPCRMCAP